MKRLLFAANWKMHMGPESAREFLRVFLQRHKQRANREIWFFPPAISITAAREMLSARSEFNVGAQNVYWEERGAFTGETGIGMTLEAGVCGALVGHSERRHVFGESDEETGKKVRALLAFGLTPFLCVGEKLEERENGRTATVVERQMGVLDGLDSDTLGRIIIAYEPVWAIGTGRTAGAEDAAEVHAAIRGWLVSKGVPGRSVRILYGGSVKLDNVRELLAQEEIDGVLVGGASLEPATWAALTQIELV
ncbi:MAG: triose-phosphate isomerase [Gemmatimonadales bacterium]